MLNYPQYIHFQFFFHGPTVYLFDAGVQVPDTWPLLCNERQPSPPRHLILVQSNGRLTRWSIDDDNVTTTTTIDARPIWCCLSCRRRLRSLTAFHEHLHQRHASCSVDERWSTSALIDADGESIRYLHISSIHPAPAHRQPMIDVHRSTNNMVHVDQLTPSCTNTGTARNSSKTLKCPKCNWHYKYQETLEIHMKEKHADSEISCTYCQQNRAHPKLARGETYGCGYKPYRCDICKYSTTTKGNLSIHMQSDKHLNNTHELQLGNKLIDPADLIHVDPPASSSSPPMTAPSINTSSVLVQQQQPAYRCDDCMYQTNIARNLRIHMTSDKHSQNMRRTRATTAMVEPPVGCLPLSSDNNIAGLSNQLAFNDDDFASFRVFQCGICAVFGTGSVDELLAHMDQDRCQLIEGDTTFIDGAFTCNLCPYTTPLKANFQLHTKTDKHTLRVQLTNHMREGGLENWYRMRQHQQTSSVQARCNACGEFFTCAQAIEVHALSTSHLSAVRGVQLVLNGRCVRCKLCAFETGDIESMLEHIQGTEHSLNVARWTSCDGGPDEIFASSSSSTAASETDMQLDEHIRHHHTTTAVQCPVCPTRSTQLDRHLAQVHNIPDEGRRRLLATLALSSSPSTTTITTAVAADSTTSSSSNGGLIATAPDSTTTPVPTAVVADDDATCSSSYACPACAVRFASAHQLYEHQTDSGHLELKSTPDGGAPAYWCWHTGCQAYFPTVHALQMHFQDTHTKRTAASVSDRHVYRFRCSQCSLAFRTEDRLKTHSLYHAFRANTRCVLCERNFRSVETLRRHVQLDHSNETAAGVESTPDVDDETATTIIATTTADIVNGGSTTAKNVSMDKYLDPSRPFKCETCKESFTQKNILVVHYNSVSHLHKTKKLLESQPTNFVVSPEVMAVLSKPATTATTTTTTATSPSTSSTIDSKPYKCNVCKLSYGQGSTLDIHRRSVAHQSRLSRLSELIATGEFDPSKPQIEQPTSGSAGSSSTSKLVNATKRHSDGADFEVDASAALKMHQQQYYSQQQQQQQQEQIAMMNMLNMAQLFHMAQQSMVGQQQQHPNYYCERCLAAFATDDALRAHGLICGKQNGTGTSDDDYDRSVRSTGQQQQQQQRPTGAPFRKMLENYGFELVMQFNENNQQRKRKSTNIENGTSSIIKPSSESSRLKCTQCDREFSSVWVLKAHSEQVHRCAITCDAIDIVSEQLRAVLDEQQQKKKVVVKDESTPPDNNRPPSVNLPTTTAGGGGTGIITPAAAVPTATTKPVQPPAKRAKRESTSAATVASEMSKFNEQMALMQTMMGVGCFPPFPFLNPATAGAFPSPFFGSPFLPPMIGQQPSTSTTTTDFDPIIKNNSVQHPVPTTNHQSSPAKRARTRITDDQLKILREYFDINNSPTEEQIREMSTKAALPEKVIKHWFRNTLFKERQRDKDSPYNFNIPPSLAIDLDMYERTGEAKIIPFNDATSKEQQQQQPAKSAVVQPIEQTSIKVEAQPVPPPQPTIDPFTASSSDADSEKNNNSTASFTEALQRLQQQMPAVVQSQLLANALNAAAVANNPFNLFMNVGAGAATSPTVDKSSSGDTMTSLMVQQSSSGGGSISSGSGRRANRTRFTDYQLRTLQEFFEKQAYPKDDDLEFLSKKMQLSPRVIVVWFQNARQKARKIYENTPHGAGGGTAGDPTSDRFVKTPGCNYQCRRCALVFQRYYELIQHQQKHCYKDDGAAQQSDNAKCGLAVSEGEDDEEEDEMMLGNDDDDDTASKTFSTSESPSPSSKASTPAIRPPVAGARRRKEFNKRCPFCGILFYSKESLLTHLPKRHPEQLQRTMVNIDALPDAEEIPTINIPTTTGDDQQCSTTGTTTTVTNFGDLAQSMLKMGMFANNSSSESSTNPIDLLKKHLLSDSTSNSSTTTPLDLSGGSGAQHQLLNVHTTGVNCNGGGGGGGPPTDGGSNGSMSMSASPSCTMHSDDETGGRLSTFSQYEDKHHHHAGSSSSSKRFRTHLSPMQVQVMKSLFADYKTPSMSECETLGHVISLHKRVVQVWYQNARAKERKSKVNNGDDDGHRSISTGGGANTSSTTRCAVCRIDYTPQLTLQDHIFTSEHIARIKELLRSNGTDDSVPDGGGSGQPPHDEHHHDQRPPRSKTKSRERRRSTTSASATNTTTGTITATNNDIANALLQLQSLPPPPSAVASTSLAAAFTNNPLQHRHPNLSAAFGQFNPYFSFPGMYDTALIGTPITSLQIPESVMQQISTDLLSGNIHSTRFTQDGKLFSELAATLLTTRDFQCAAGKDGEVGWACRQCMTVFQHEDKLMNHQKLFAHPPTNYPFVLIQTHYECRACNLQFGTQEEYKNHCTYSDHQIARDRFFG